MRGRGVRRLVWGRWGNILTRSVAWECNGRGRYIRVEIEVVYFVFAKTGEVEGGVNGSG